MNEGTPDVRVYSSSRIRNVWSRWGIYTRHKTNTESTLGQRRRRWPSVDPVFGWRLADLLIGCCSKVLGASSAPAYKKANRGSNSYTLTIRAVSTFISDYHLDGRPIYQSGKHISRYVYHHCTNKKKIGHNHEDIIYTSSRMAAAATPSTISWPSREAG